jgi:hypothetical protein
MKYKPCCGKRCMVAGCETKEQGACYCICRMHDQIRDLERIIEGRTLYDGIGMQYIPNDQFRQQVLDSWSDVEKETLRLFKLEAPNLILKFKEKLKEYEIE